MATAEPLHKPKQVMLWVTAVTVSAGGCVILTTNEAVHGDAVGFVIIV